MEIIGIEKRSFEVIGAFETTGTDEKRYITFRRYDDGEWKTTIGGLWRLSSATSTVIMEDLYQAHKTALKTKEIKEKDAARDAKDFGRDCPECGGRLEIARDTYIVGAGRSFCCPECGIFGHENLEKKKGRKLKALFVANVYCPECGFMMTREFGKIIKCKNKECSMFDRKFKQPGFILEEIEK